MERNKRDEHRDVRHMSHVRPSPVSLRDAVHRLFDESLWDPFEESVFSDRGLRDVFPKVDISETESEVKVVANVPGIDPEKVSIEVDEEVLSLSGTIDESTEEKDERRYRYEREFGEFRRDFILPARVDPDAVSAHSKDGVLTVRLPKRSDEQGGRRTVSVKRES